MSNIIKPSYYITLDEAKLIAFHHQPVIRESEPTDSEKHTDLTELPEVIAAQELSNKIIQDAEYHAEQLIQQAHEQISQMKEQAAQEIEDWWTQRREQDKQAFEQSQQDGYEQGYKAGYEEADQELRRHYADVIEEAKNVLELAHRMKEQIIQEAEPFLLDLSIAIAQKIMDRQATIDSSWVIENIKKLLAQRQDNGSITLSVSPSQFDYIASARQELLMAVDPQIELHIHPDANIKDQGCIVRSSFGSIDATVGTQLQEIKRALKEMSHSYEEIIHAAT